MFPSPYFRKIKKKVGGWALELFVFQEEACTAKYLILKGVKIRQSFLKNFVQEVRGGKVCGHPFQNSPVHLFTHAAKKLFYIEK